jgi:hypothetical protein
MVLARQLEFDLQAANEIVWPAGKLRNADSINAGD